MKRIITVILVFLSIHIHAQNLKYLNDIASNDGIPIGKAIIYGNFIQRLGFSSGGFPQDIRLINTDTKEVLAFRVKPTFKSSKENTFIYTIEPGNYAILNYWWTNSKWYGGKMYTEYIFKNTDTTDGFEDKVNAGLINLDELERFTFKITENSLNYLGTWHFKTPLVSFKNDKGILDNKIKNKYKAIDFSQANVVLPN
ncbi:hypothetical protein [uncultured Sphingobacterium sp.]|uniref:hypothetical protein n=1 Tax=uncultured Sphingobacterium sp. TaxID=182688 RepID=UPI0025E8E3C4|nr:hypothetical protein [uncultured Sphingobacterium sp.]